jgi:copper(I)-binding protein
VILSSRAAPLRVLAMVVAAAVAPVIAGCEAGFSAPTQQWHQPAAGASAVVNNVLRINNVFVLGAAPAFSLPRGSSAGLFLAITNEGAAPDRLIGVTAPGTAAAVQLPAGGVRLAGQQQVLLSGPAPRVILRRLIRSVNGGQSILVVLHFVRAGNVTMAVPVMPRAQWFSTFSPAPLLVSPSPSPTGTASPSPSGTSPSPSPSATG